MLSKKYDASIVGLYILDVLGRPVSKIPDGGNVEFIEELRVDIAADNTPANNTPLKPTGKWVTMKDASSLSFSISTPPMKAHINEPTQRKIENCKKTKKPEPIIAILADVKLLHVSTLWTIM